MESQLEIWTKFKLTNDELDALDGALGKLSKLYEQSLGHELPEEDKLTPFQLSALNSFGRKLGEYASQIKKLED